MIEETIQRVIEIYGPDYKEVDIPTIIRKQEIEFADSIGEEWKDKKWQEDMEYLEN